MKYVIALVLGFIAGAVLFALIMLYNPFIANRGVSPLSVTDAEVITLNFSNVPSDSILYTNDGESLQKPNPEKVLQLWEPPIRLTSAMATTVRDGRNQAAGIGIKFASKSESTRLFRGDAIVDSVWYLYLPEHGSMFVQQTENYWSFLRDVAFPAWRSSANNWRGSWFGDLTAGPGVLGTAVVSGGSGRVKGLDMAGVESMSVRAFSMETGLIAADGRLVIEIPDVDDSTASVEP